MAFEPIALSPLNLHDHSFEFIKLFVVIFSHLLKEDFILLSYLRHLGIVVKLQHGYMFLIVRHKTLQLCFTQLVQIIQLVLISFVHLLQLFVQHTVNNVDDLLSGFVCPLFLRHLEVMFALDVFQQRILLLDHSLSQLLRLGDRVNFGQEPTLNHGEYFAGGGLIFKGGPRTLLAVSATTLLDFIVDAYLNQVFQQTGQPLMQSRYCARL